MICEVQVDFEDTLKVLAMALEPRLWGTLSKELLHLVFVHFPAIRISQLRVLSKEWKRNIDCKDLEFNQLFSATTHFKMFVVMSWTLDSVFVSLYDVEVNKCHFFENGMDYYPLLIPSIADGGLVCCPWQLRNTKWHLEIVVVNTLNQKKMKFPPLFNMGAGKSNVRVEMVQFTMDKNTKEYKVHVVGDMKASGNDRLFTQVYDSHTKAWSIEESSEGRCRIVHAYTT